MKKILIISILVIAVIAICAGCIFGTAPSIFGVAPDDYSIRNTQSNQSPSSNTGTSNSTGNQTATNNSTATVKPSQNSASSSDQSAPLWGVTDPIEYTPTLVVYDTTTPMDVKINLGSGVTSIESIEYLGRRQTKRNKSDDYFRYTDGLLYISQSFLTLPSSFQSSNGGTGEFKIKVTTNNGSEITCKLCCATRVINEPDEFTRIGDIEYPDYPLNGTYVLGKDLDFNGAKWCPIGYSDDDLSKYDEKGNCIDPNNHRPFTGVFEGAGHTISNIDIDLTASGAIGESHNPFNAGLFAINEGTIRNLCLKNCALKSKGLTLGLVVGTNKGTIENVLVDGGTVRCTHPNPYPNKADWDTNCFIAGFAGINAAGATIKNCICAIGSIGRDIWDGKLTRAFCGKTWGEIENCYATTENISIDLLTNSSGTNKFPTTRPDGSNWEIAGWGKTTDDQNSFINIANEWALNGFTYTAVSAEIIENVTDYIIKNDYNIIRDENGEDKNAVKNCAVKTRAEMVAGTTADIYQYYDTNIWNITGTILPSLRRLNAPDNTNTSLEIHDSSGNNVDALTLYVGDVLDLTNYIHSDISLNAINVVLDTGADAYVSLSGKKITANTASGDNYATVKLHAPDYNKEYSFRISIKDLPSFEFNTANIDLYVDQQLDLNDCISIADASISYSLTEGTTYVTINGHVITGVAGGDATVEATLTLADDFLNTPIKTTATIKVKQINFSSNDLTITKGDTVNLNNYLTITNITSPTLVWSITTGADAIIEMPSADGNITPLAKGSATVKVSCTLTDRTLEATLNIQVIEPSSPELVVVHKDNIYDAHVTFTSLGDTIASAQQPASEQADGQVSVKELTQNEDYTYSKTSETCLLILKSSYLSQLAQKTGQYELKFTDTNSVAQIVTVLVVDEVITTREQLQAIGNDEEALKKSYVLGADIDCGGFANKFEPIGEYYNDNYWKSGLPYKNKPFKGTLNGAGHKIYNLVIDSTAENYTKEVHKDSGSGNGWVGGKNTAFISYLGETGRLCNITFENVCVYSTHQLAGVVAGTVCGKIENVKLDSLKVYSGTAWIPATPDTAIDGFNSYTINTGNWEGGGEFGLDSFSGAFAGIVSESGEIKNCIAMTTIKSNDPKAIRGFVGKCYGVISDCYSYALSPLNKITGGTLKDFSSEHIDFNPLTSNDETSDGDLKTIMSCYTSEKDILIDLNHISDSDTAGKGFTYPAFYGYWDNTAHQLVEAKLTDGSWTSYTNTYYTQITDCAMVNSLTALQDATLFSNFNSSLWTITNGTVPSLKITYNA